MIATHLYTPPIFAKRSVLHLRRTNTSFSLCCTWKYNYITNEPHVGFEENEVDVCEATLNKQSPGEPSSRDILLPGKRKQALFDFERIITYEESWESITSNIDDERKHVEAERRRKIGLANKGRTPWNKGVKHKAETRELIRERTIEALRDPKVKKKMREAPHFHSDKSKAKISISLRKLWEARLMEKEVQEKFYRTWALSIAELAKMGGYGQEELGWNSYEELKAEIVAEHLQWKEEKARRSQSKKLKRAERKAEKKARLVQLELERKEKEEKRKFMEIKKAKQKLEDEKRVFLNRLRRKAKLCKLVVPVRIRDSGTRNEQDVAKWDLEFVKKEQLRRGISLADQIRAAKARRLPPLPVTPSRRDKISKPFFNMCNMINVSS